MALDSDAPTAVATNGGGATATATATATPNSASVHFGRLVAARRLELGLSQEKLAARMGTSQSVVARIEAGEPLNTRARQRLTDALRIEPETNAARRLIARAADSGIGSSTTGESFRRRSLSSDLAASRQRLSGGLAAASGMLRRLAAAANLERPKAALSGVPNRVPALDGAGVSPRQAALSLAAAAALLFSLVVLNAGWARVGLTLVTVAALWLSAVVIKRNLRGASTREPATIIVALWVSVIAVGLVTNGAGPGVSGSSTDGTASAIATPLAATLAQNGAAGAILASEAAASGLKAPPHAKSHPSSPSAGKAPPSPAPGPPSAGTTFTSAPPPSPTRKPSSPSAKPGGLSSDGSQSGSSGAGSTGAQSGSGAGAGSNPIGNIVNSIGNAHQRP